MKLKNSLLLILSASVVLGYTAVEIADQPSLANLSASAQENPSRSQDYSFIFNRQPEVTYSNTLPNGNQYLPLFPILDAMGADYEWDRSQNTVFISQGDDTVKLEPGEGVAEDEPQRERRRLIFNY